MVGLFDSYEQQYSVLTADITAQIGRLSTSNNENKRHHVSEIEKHIDEAQELLEQMELEVHEIESSQRQKYKSRLECYRTELKRLCQEFSNARTVKITNGYDSCDDYSDVRLTEDQKRRLLDNSERIERTGNQLNSGYRILQETEQISHQVLQDLSSQRESIQRSRGRLRETDEELSRSSRLMNTMIMRSIQQRLVLYLVGFAFIVAISLGIYLSVNKHS